MEVAELLEDKAGQSHGRVVRKWQPRNSCTTTRFQQQAVCPLHYNNCTVYYNDLSAGLQLSDCDPGRDRTSIQPLLIATPRVYRRWRYPHGARHWRATPAIIRCVCGVAGVETESINLHAAGTF